MMQASDPHSSAWVAANAGSGKTYILVTRLVRLMLSGVAPEKLLCLTYTRSAAAEMQDRLFTLLAEWALLDDATLQAEIDARLGMQDGHHNLALARMLFARALETPGGLRVQTIHSFCESLLKRFPLEAGLSPQFDLLDEHEARAIQSQIIRGLLARQSDEELRHALNALTRQISEPDLQALASTILSQRDKFNAVPEAERQARLRRHLKLDHLPTDQTPQPQAVAEAHIEAYRQAAPDLAKWLGAAKSVTDNKRANQLAEFMELVKAGQMDAAWACLNRVFVTQKGQPVARLATAGSAQDNPEAMTALQQWADAFYEALALYRASINYQLTDAMNVFARHLLHDYAAVKEQRGVLDYDDLIARTNEMLAQSRAAAWVLFKIDSGLEHILVDEAQDTSPAQWRVIRALAEEFFSGDTAQQTTRTIFAVGDEKQSIFSFQGADPAGFDEQYQYFSNMIESIGGTVNYVPLQMSWRSAPEILHLVDALFASPENAHGLSAAGKPTAHMAQREESTGYVALWDLERADAPDDQPPAEDVPKSGVQETARQKLAQRIADKISGFLSDRESGIRAGDILILVRQRDDFVDDMIRALKQRGNIPVAGADRMALLEQIAIMDLMAAAEFALNPDDDLSLACVLRSPLGGLSDDQLFDLAHGRKGSLWSALCAVAEDDAYADAYASVHQRLTWLLDQVDYLRPYNYFAEFLVGQNAHALLRARLGLEIDDAIGEFLRLALAFESQHVASMQGFLHFVRQGEQVIKRDMETSQDAVRIMTVHGAKGLEAPIVFLPDTCGAPTGGARQRSAVQTGGGEVMWRAKAEMREPYSQEREDQARAAEIAEAKRLLYVALTRARDRLYIGGHLSGRRSSPADGSWYQMLAEVMQTPARASTEGGRDIWHFGDEAAAIPARDGQADVSYEATQAPAWAFEKISQNAAQAQMTAEKIFAPSHMQDGRHAPTAPDRDAKSDGQAGVAGVSQENQQALLRGTLAHALFEHLPALSPHARHAAAENYIHRHGQALSEAEREQIIEDTLAVITHPDMAQLFAPQSRAEAPIAGSIALDNGARLQFSGQIDRYVETEEEIYLVDFKTGHVPQTGDGADMPSAYIRQMAIYRALMQAARPGKPVRCGLVWTQACRTDWLSEKMLDDALAHVTARHQA